MNDLVFMQYIWMYQCSPSHIEIAKPRSWVGGRCLGKAGVPCNQDPQGLENPDFLP